MPNRFCTVDSDVFEDDGKKIIQKQLNVSNETHAIFAPDIHTFHLKFVCKWKFL